MAHYFTDPLDVTDTFSRLKNVLQSAPAYWGSLSTRSVASDYNSSEHVFHPAQREEDIELLRLLESLPRNWLIYDRKNVGPDYHATMFDATGFAGVNLIVCELLLAEGEPDKETAQFVALFFVGFENEADLQTFKRECENRDLVV